MLWSSPSGTSISVLVVDDSDVIRESLLLFVEATPGLVVWGEAQSGEEVLTKLAEAGDAGPDVVVCDVAMGGMSGIDVVARIRAQQATTPFLMLSAHKASLFEAEARAAGAQGYVEKDNPAALIDAIQKVGAGGEYWQAGA